MTTSLPGIEKEPGQPGYYTYERRHGRHAVTFRRALARSAEPIPPGATAKADQAVQDRQPGRASSTQLAALGRRVSGWSPSLAPRVGVRMGGLCRQKSI